MANSTALWELPPLPSYTLTPRPYLIPAIPDKYLSLLLPIFAYWAFSMIFHIIDTRDYFPQYRLHTPTEVLKRNHVSRWEVVRDVVIQQVIQTIVGVLLALDEGREFDGKDQYNVAVWAQRLRLAQRAIPGVLAVIGVDAQALALRASTSSPSLAGAISGGQYLAFASQLAEPSFATWELVAAKLLYWLIVPTLQFALAIVIVDTWQYFLHRAMHMNKWLYTTFHSRHHRLYVPYAYGALYNHPFEGFLLDTLGTGLAYLIVGLSPRQAICFFTGSTIKTVDDHCGYALPWDPLQHLTSNNAGYHDVHHQSWGIKTNFSQPFFTFWDRALGTVWTGGDVSARYERARRAAERKSSSAGESVTDRQRGSSLVGGKPVEAESEIDSREIVSASTVPSVSPAQDAAVSLLESPTAGTIFAEAADKAAAEERKAYLPPLKGQRRRTLQSSPSTQAGSLKGLRDRVAGAGAGGHGHGGTVGVLGYESTG